MLSETPLISIPTSSFLSFASLMTSLSALFPVRMSTSPTDVTVSPRCSLRTSSANLCKCADIAKCMDTTTSHLEAILFRVKNGRPVVPAAEFAELPCCRPYSAQRKRMCAVRGDWYVNQDSNEYIRFYAAEEGMVGHLI